MPTGVNFSLTVEFSRSRTHPREFTFICHDRLAKLPGQPSSPDRSGAARQSPHLPGLQSNRAVFRSRRRKGANNALCSERRIFFRRYAGRRMRVPPLRPLSACRKKSRQFRRPLFRAFHAPAGASVKKTDGTRVPAVAGKKKNVTISLCYFQEILARHLLYANEVNEHEPLQTGGNP